LLEDLSTIALDPVLTILTHCVGNPVSVINIWIILWAWDIQKLKATLAN